MLREFRMDYTCRTTAGSWMALLTMLADVFLLALGVNGIGPT